MAIRCNVHVIEQLHNRGTEAVTQQFRLASADVDGFHEIYERQAKLAIVDRFEGTGGLQLAERADRKIEVGHSEERPEIVVELRLIPLVQRTAP